MKILNTIKKQLHTMSMTEKERTDIRLNLAHHMHTYKPRNPLFMLSPYMNGVWQKRIAISAAAFLVVMISGGSGLAYASFDSLPGDKLYTVKVTTEEIQAAIKATPQARADFEVKRAERRINEAVTLAVNGKLDDSKKAAITANLKRHTKQVAIETSKLVESNPEQAVEVSARLALSLEAHTRIIADAQEQNIVNGELVAIADEVSHAQAEAEIEKASATEKFVAQEGTTTKEQLDEKKERIALAIQDWNNASEEAAAKDLPVTAATASLETTASYASLAASDSIQPFTEPVMMMAKMSAPTITPKEAVANLLAEANSLIEDNNYKEAFLILQRAEELIAKINLDLVTTEESEKLPESQETLLQTQEGTASDIKSNPLPETATNGTTQIKINTR